MDIVTDAAEHTGLSPEQVRGYSDDDIASAGRRGGHVSHIFGVNGDEDDDGRCENCGARAFSAAADRRCGA